MQTFTPGWNDPPSLSRGSNQGGSSTAVRSMLNKRVAFPIGNNSGQTGNIPQMAPISGIPVALVPAPNPASVAVAAAPPSDATFITAAAAGFEAAFDSSQTVAASDPVTINNTPLPPPSASAVPSAAQSPPNTIQLTNEEIREILTAALDSCINIPPQTKDNISKRLDKLQAALAQSTLSAPCRQKLDTLVNAMKEARYTDSYNIHSTMMVDYFSEVSQWMVGVKALILECQKRGS